MQHLLKSSNERKPIEMRLSTMEKLAPWGLFLLAIPWLTSADIHSFWFEHMYSRTIIQMLDDLDGAFYWIQKAGFACAKVNFYQFGVKTRVLSFKI